MQEAELRGASVDELRALLGKGRAKRGIFEGNLEEGELEIGQIASMFRKEEPVADIMNDLVEGYRRAASRLPQEL